MNDITFDKLTFVDRLKSGGMAEDHARLHAEALDIALREGVASRHDLEIAVSDIKGELRLVKWMLALVVAATVIPLLKGLF